MHGNVWEWCSDPWHENYEGAPNDGSAWISENSNNKVICGISWLALPFGCRSAYRYGSTRAYLSDDIGFRVVCVMSSAT